MTSRIAGHDAAPETTLVLPSLDAFALTDVPDVHLRVLGETEQLARSLSLSRAGPPQRADGRVGFERGDDLRCAGSPVDEVDMSATAGDGEDVTGGVEGADVHARVLVVAEGGSPQAARRTVGGARLEVVGVVERTGTGEHDGRTARVEHGVCQREGRDVERLCVWVGQAIDLAVWMPNEKTRFGAERTRRT